MKVSELTGEKLDYWVARIVNPGGYYVIEDDGVCWEIDPPRTDGYCSGRRILSRSFQPSTEWFDLGPLIDKFKINIEWVDDGKYCSAFIKPVTGPDDVRFGQTPQIAACRAIVASVYGEEVDDE